MKIDLVPGKLYKITAKAKLDYYDKINIETYIKTYCIEYVLFLAKNTQPFPNFGGFGCILLTTTGKTFVIYKRHIHCFDFELISK